MSRTSPPIYLSHEERAALERNVKGQKVEKRLYLRSRIVLMAADGLESTEIAKLLNVSEKTCRKWRQRFDEKRLDGIADLERCGAPETFSENERLTIIRLACAEPTVLKNWTLAHLTEMAKEKIGRSISIETVRQILKSAKADDAVLPNSRHTLYIRSRKNGTQ
ncbi:MAG: helix-turn-helix domain-containing protein [Desulfobulbaceae bacterium]|jgi:transposase|nr:helix-turn-helix domain-containing protein [Desulfobulbaceae bacterium]